MGLARLSDPALADWIAETVAFPNGMVDRITPATGPRERAMAQDFGLEDPVPVTCEPFRQWVVEDHFPAGRPALEKVGVTFTPRVHAFETMKIRILNGGHATLAYPAGLMDIVHVHQAMADPLILGFLDRVEAECILPHVPPVPSTDIPRYYRTVRDRFANPEVADTVRRLCHDGSNRQPKFILPSLRDALADGATIEGMALVSALWCRYCYGRTDSGQEIAANDPDWPALTDRARRARSDPQAWLAMTAIYGDLGQNPRFARSFSDRLGQIWAKGVRAALAGYLPKGPCYKGRPSSYSAARRANGPDRKGSTRTSVPVEGAEGPGRTASQHSPASSGSDTTALPPAYPTSGDRAWAHDCRTHNARHKSFAVRKGRRHAEMRCRALLARQGLHPGSGPFQRAFGVVLQPLAQSHQKQGLAVGRALAVGVKRVRDHHLGIAAEVVIAADLAVVHEGPAPDRERMAVVAAGGCAGRGADMGKEKVRFHLPVIEARFGSDQAGRMSRKRPGSRCSPYQASPEPVRIDRRLAFARAMALLDQRMARTADDFLKKDRLPDIGGPSAHGLSPFTPRPWRACLPPACDRFLNRPLRRDCGRIAGFARQRSE